MNATDLVKDLCAEIRTLTSDLDIANYRNENLKTERVSLEEHIQHCEETIKSLKEENEALKKKIEDLEF